MRSHLYIYAVHIFCILITFNIVAKHMHKFKQSFNIIFKIISVRFGTTSAAPNWIQNLYSKPES